MNLKNNILKIFYIISGFTLIISCNNSKVIGERVGIHYIYYPNVRPAPPEDTKKTSFTTDSAGFIVVKEVSEQKFVIAQEEELKEKVTHTLFIDKKLNVTVEINFSTAVNLFYIGHENEPEFTYFGKGEVIDDIIKVSFFKKEERELNGNFCTYFYTEPFMVDYLITKNNNGIDCVLFYFDSYNDNKYHGIDKEIWTYEYWLYTPKQIRKRDKSWGIK